MPVFRRVIFSGPRWQRNAQMKTNLRSATRALISTENIKNSFRENGSKFKKKIASVRDSYLEKINDLFSAVTGNNSFIDQLQRLVSFLVEKKLKSAIT